MSKLSNSNPFDDEDDTPWGGGAGAGAPPPDDGDLIQNALAKEKMINDIQGLQEGLKALLSRITTVKGDTEKLATENLMLDQYIANLSKK
ncbi:hypothetical protein BDY24DRAFT_397483 [Mrakia frigida]|uniref:uncharacterized protein n=1 Tax=Mrakia frigida TaxID=29902 RepID=UPI003FCBFC58